MWCKKSNTTHTFFNIVYTECLFYRDHSREARRSISEKWQVLSLMEIWVHPNWKNSQPFVYILGVCSIKQAALKRCKVSSQNNTGENRNLKLTEKKINTQWKLFFSALEFATTIYINLSSQIFEIATKKMTWDA